MEAAAFFQLSKIVVDVFCFNSTKSLLGTFFSFKFWTTYLEELLKRCRGNAAARVRARIPTIRRSRNRIPGEVEVATVVLVDLTVRRREGLRIDEGRIDPAHPVQVDQARAVRVLARTAPDLLVEGLRIRRKVNYVWSELMFLIILAILRLFPSSILKMSGSRIIVTNYFKYWKSSKLFLNKNNLDFYYFKKKYFVTHRSISNGMEAQELKMTRVKIEYQNKVSLITLSIFYN